MDQGVIFDHSLELLPVVLLIRYHGARQVYDNRGLLICGHLMHPIIMLLTQYSQQGFHTLPQLLGVWIHGVDALAAQLLDNILQDVCASKAAIHRTTSLPIAVAMPRQGSHLPLR